jgi:sugar phosphate isomerase/epimerase
MILSCCAWAFSGLDVRILEEVAKAGFNWIDLRPFALSGRGGRQELESAGLGVSCVGVSAVLPEDLSLDSADSTRAADALTRVSKGVQYAAEIGAATAYLVPTLDSDKVALKRFASAASALADQALALGLKLCLEHAPGTALPTVVQTLDFIDSVGHENLFLLMDTGHLQMCDEDPESSIERAGERLGYVHLDDNDGVGDLHLALLDGVMTVESLSRTFTILKRVGYAGAVSVELSENLPDPQAAVSRSRRIILDIEPSLA